MTSHIIPPGKKWRFIWTTFFLLSLGIFTGCGESDESPVIQNPNLNQVPKHLKGNWLRLDGGTIHLGDSTEYAINEIDENMLEIYDKKWDATFFAARFGTHQAKLSMIVSRPNYSASKGVSGIGSIDVILQDVNDSGNRHQVRTDQDGSVNQEDLISSDYTITVPETDTHRETQVECTVTGEKDIAVITPARKGEYSFRTELVMDQEFVYGDYDMYTGDITVTNVGDIDAEAVSYVLSSGDNSLIQLTDATDLSAILKTIESSKTKTIPIEFLTHFLSDADLPDDYVDDSIPITLIDLQGNEWESYVPVRIYRKKVVLNTADLRRNSNYNSLTGLIVFPDRYLKRLGNAITYTFPMSRGIPYALILSNLSADEEDTYSIGFGTTCHTQDELSEFMEPNKDESGSGNNTESTAITLRPNDRYIGYIHKMDIDYFLLDMSEETMAEPVALACLESKSFYSVHDTTSASLETLGNSDGRISPGESVRLNLGVTNTGTSTAYGVTTCLSLSGQDEYVTIPETLSCSDQYNSPMGDINGGTTVDSNGRIENGYAYFSIGDYLLQISDETPVGHNIDLTATMTDAYGHTWTSNFSVPVENHGAVLAYYPPPETIKTIQDANNTNCPTCNADGIINPGERVRLNIAIQNTGTSPAYHVSAEIALQNAQQTGVTLVTAQSDNNAYREYIGPDQIVACGGLMEEHAYFLDGTYGDYVIEFSEGFPEGAVEFMLMMHDDLGNEWNDTFSLMVVP